MRWDPFIRVFHWSVVTGVVLDYWFLEGGDEPHEWVGYAVLALVGLRILWGFLGPANARFVSFVTGPGSVAANLKEPAGHHRDHSGHSPAGGWMILLLLVLLIAAGVTGWMQELDRFWGEEWVQDLHEYVSHGLVVAASVHVLAVLWLQLRYKLPLVQRMLW